MLVQSAHEALEILEDNDVIWCQSMAAKPYKLLDGLADVAMQRHNLTLLHAQPKQSELSTQMGQRVASLINDGDCLQMGIGAIPDATRW